MHPTLILFEHLKDTENSDSIEAAVDGTTPVNFDYTAPAGRVAEIERLNLTLVDDAVEDIDGFFTLAALTNGLLLQVLDIDGSTVLQHFGTDEAAIKTHNDLGTLAGIDVLTLGDAVPAVRRFIVRWTLSKAGSSLTLNSGMTFRMVVPDNLSALTQFRAMIQGVLNDNV